MEVPKARPGDSPSARRARAARTERQRSGHAQGTHLRRPPSTDRPSVDRGHVDHAREPSGHHSVYASARDPRSDGRVTGSILGPRGGGAGAVVWPARYDVANQTPPPTDERGRRSSGDLSAAQPDHAPGALAGPELPDLSPAARSVARAQMAASSVIGLATSDFVMPCSAASSRYRLPLAGRSQPERFR